jgi:hypothetical protein
MTQMAFACGECRPSKCGRRQRPHSHFQEGEPMSNDPDAPTGEQETTPEASSAEERTAPQASSGQSPQEKSATQTADKPATQTAGKQEFYWRRQAEKLEKELAALRAEREAELSRATRDRDEAAARAAAAEWRAERLSLIAASGLPSELAELVPEGDPEAVAGYVEKLKPIAEKLSRPLPRGLTNTNPPNRAGRDEARLDRLASEAARGDRRALREYAHLRDRVKRA